MNKSKPDLIFINVWDGCCIRESGVHEVGCWGGVLRWSPCLPRSHTSHTNQENCLVKELRQRCNECSWQDVWLKKWRSKKYEFFSSFKSGLGGKALKGGFWVFWKKKMHGTLFWCERNRTFHFRDFKNNCEGGSKDRVAAVLLFLIPQLWRGERRKYPGSGSPDHPGPL